MQIKIVSKIKNGSNENGNGKGEKEDLKPKKIKLPELSEIEN